MGGSVEPSFGRLRAALSFSVLVSPAVGMRDCGEPASVRSSRAWKQGTTTMRIGDDDGNGDDNGDDDDDHGDDGVMVMMMIMMMMAAVGLMME